MNHLLRSHAPVPEPTWAVLDEEARKRLVPALAARRLVDFAGPHGWHYSSTNLGRSASVEAPGPGLEARQRLVLAVAELRAPFSLSRDEIADIERGATDLDLSELDIAAHRIAEAENVAVFHGWAAAGITGVAPASTHPKVPLGADYARYPSLVAGAVGRLREAGVGGPYGLVLGPGGYTGVAETTEHGTLVVFDHLRQILDGPVVWAPGVTGAIVLSLRGGDFQFDSGQDLSIGYDHHDGQRVHLYLEESFSFRTASPEAAVAFTA